MFNLPHQEFAKIPHSKSQVTTMNIKSALTSITCCALLVSCASDPIDPLDPTVVNKDELQPQCPIGYEPVYSTEIVIKSTEEDKKTGKAKKTFKCEPIK